MQSILQIVVESLPLEERRGLVVAEEVHAMRGRSAEPAQLRGTLEIAIAECMRRRIRYAKIMLKRLKQLERGEYRPAIPIAPAGTAAAAGVRPKAAAVERARQRDQKERTG